MAGSSIKSTESVQRGTTPVSYFTFEFVADDTNGSISEVTFNHSGFISGVSYLAGTPASASITIAVKDELGVACVSETKTASGRLYQDKAEPVDGKCTLSFTNSTVSATGTVRVYVS